MNFENNLNFLDGLTSLDDKQKKAVLAPPGTLRIIAGAGTGKTTTLTHRIAYWHKEGSMPASQVLAMTHSKKAAKELRKRLSVLGVPEVTAKTFHALAFQLLRENWKIWQGDKPWPDLIKETDHHFSIKSITERILRSRNNSVFIREYDTALGRDIRGELELARSRMIKPDKYLSSKVMHGPGNGISRQEFFEIYSQYEKMKRSRNLIDFADQLEFAIEMLESMDGIRSTVQKRYRYFYIDEYQDIDPIQERFFQLLRGDSIFISVVGDPRQTIYSFKGSEPKFLIDFDKYYKDTTSIDLVKNYRSTGRIVQQANRLMRNSSANGGANLDLQTVKQMGDTPQIEEFEAQNHELAGLVSKIKKSIDIEGITPREIAILVRTNSNIPIIRAYLSKAGIETKSPGDNFWEDVMTLLNRFHSEFHQTTEVLGVELLKQVATKLNWWKEEPDLNINSYRQDLTEALLTLALQVDPDNKLNPEQLLQEFTRMNDSYVDDDDVNAVTVLSVHKAKGLEWDAVFMPMFIDGLYPISHARNQEEIDEEQRVLYVGITRPRKKLVLSWCKQANLYNRRQAISRFASKLKYETHVPEDPKVVAQRRFTQSQSLYGLRIGDRVNHQKHGMGKVIGISGNFLQIDFGKSDIVNVPANEKDLEKL